jgi:hypothetical protein
VVKNRDFTHPIKEDVKKKTFPLSPLETCWWLYIQPRPLRGGVFGFCRFGSPRIIAAMPTPVAGFQVMVSSRRGRLTPIRCEATQAHALAFSANHHPM